MSANGPLLDALNAAKAMLRDCYWWRRVADPESPWDDETAAAHIHFDGLPPPEHGPDHSLAELEALRPFVIMWTEQAAGFRLRNETAGYCCSIPSGVIVAQFEIAVPEDLADTPSALAADLSRKLGLILRTGNADQPGLFELSGRSGYLPINEVQVYGYARSDAKARHEVGDVIVAELQINWGME